MHHWPTEYKLEFQRRIGIWLITAPRGSQKIIANLLEVDARTVRSWKKVPPKKRGRKKIEATLPEKLLIKEEWERQGCPGSRPVIKALPGSRVRIIREVVGTLNRQKKSRRQKHQQEARVSVKVKYPGVLSVMDAATVKPQNSDFILLRDRGSISVNSTKCESRSARSEDTLRVLGELHAKKKLPLVIGTDNGSPFCSGEVENFLANHKIIHLKSLPHVPQHNGSAENSVNDFKQLVSYGLTPAQACTALNQYRRRATLNWQTPAQAEQTNSMLYTEEVREVFYNSTRAAIDTAMLGTKNAKEKRKAEREAIFQTLETFSLIVRTRGHRSAQTKAEEIT